MPDPDTFNVLAFGAKGDGTTDDTAALQAAIDAAAINGGYVWFPIGSYLVTEPLEIVTVGVHLRGTTPRSPVGGSKILAGAAMEHMILARGTPLQRMASIERLALDAAGLADWCITVDSWRQFNIRHNRAVDALVGFIRTDFSGVSDWAGSFVEYNEAGVSGSVMPPGEGMPYFLFGQRANGDTIDFITLRSNRHLRFGFDGVNTTESWSILLDGCQRCKIYDHFAQPFETANFSGIVKITNASAGTANNGRHIITDLTAEWGTQARPCIVIDGEYSESGSSSVLEACRINNIKCQPGNRVVRLDTSGTNALVRGTVIIYPLNDMVGSGEGIEVLSSNVHETFVWTFTDLNGASQLDDRIVNSGGSTSLYINGVVTRNLGGTRPSDTDLDVGYFLFDEDSRSWWGMGHAGSVVPLTAGGITTVARWIEFDDPASGQLFLGNAFVLPRQVVSVQVNVTEAFNAGADNLIRGGTDFAGNSDSIFQDVDVSTTGLKTAPLGAATYHDSNDNLRIGYTQSGTAATQGKALIVVQYAVVPAQP